MSTPSIEEFIAGMPKAELHLHIEGTFEPELMFKIAQRNGISLKYPSIEALKAAFNFNNLQEFLDIYYEGAGVLIHEQDFFDLTWAYLEKVHSQNVVYIEIFFDPQTHTDRGIAFDTVITGIQRALDQAKAQWNLQSKLIMCFLRHLDEASAIATLHEALPYKHLITAVGLDSSEVGNPPSKFERVFAMAREEGFLTVAHAGEEGPAEYIWEALDLLKVARIDHGNRCLDDPKLVKHLADLQMALTLCPLSNLELKVIHDLKDYPLQQMLENNLLITINSDDPAYFGGYMNENYEGLAKALDLDVETIYKLGKNAFEATFLEEAEKQKYLDQLESFYQDHKA